MFISAYMETFLLDRKPLSKIEELQYANIETKKRIRYEKSDSALFSIMEFPLLWISNYFLFLKAAIARANTPSPAATSAGSGIAVVAFIHQPPFAVSSKI